MKDFINIPVIEFSEHPEAKHNPHVRMNINYIRSYQAPRPEHLDTAKQGINYHEGDDITILYTSPMRPFESDTCSVIFVKMNIKEFENTVRFAQYE